MHVAATPEPHRLPNGGTKRSATSVEDLPAPRALPGSLAPVPPFDVEIMLPEPLATRVADIARRTGSPQEFAAVSLVAAFGAQIGRSSSVRPKRLDHGWVVVPNVWSALIGLPSSGKSPAFEAALAPWRALDTKRAKEHEAASAEHAIDAEVVKARREKAREKLRKAAGSKVDEEAIRDELRHEDPNEPPKMRRLIANDATVEKIGMLLADNPTGLLLVRDELAGWLAGLERQGREGDRQFYLEAWSGRGAYTIDRVGRGSLRLPALCIGVLGGIQPGKLRAYIDEALAGGDGDDGLVARLQLAVWPDVDESKVDLDVPEDRVAAEAVATLVAKVEASAGSVPPGELPSVAFDDEAQAAFDDWRRNLQRRSKSKDEHPAIAAFLVKQQETAAALALIFDVLQRLHVEQESGPVRLPAVDMALAWAELLEHHARRVYGIQSQAVAPARALLAKLRTHVLGDTFTLGDLRRSDWKGLRGEQAERALVCLVEQGWLLLETRPAGPKGGRPTTAYRVHPLAFATGGEE